MKNIKISPGFFQTVIKVIILVFLFLPPAILCGYWFFVEYEQFSPQSGNIELIGRKNITPEAAKAINDLSESSFESTKDNSSIRFSREESASGFDDFDSKVSKSITEKLWIFSSLPLHNVCLINKNHIYVNGILDDTLEPYFGGIALNQVDGYNFYTERDAKDCKNVQIEKFRNSSTTPEFSYPIGVITRQEEDEKRIRGENYVVDLATTTVLTDKSRVVISLSLWVLLIAYFLLLFAWSFIIFQFEKIYLFVRRILSKKHP